MSKKQSHAPSSDSVMNLLIISLLRDGVNPKVIATATDIPEGTIRRKFPMNLIKPETPKSKKTPGQRRKRGSNHA